ncbi:MATE family efflux transporter [Methanococcus maripaludis]|uniref:Multidrug export protein MepA n=2 Tax=Methanococcus maripaludis TaxID=39152 RepID=A0A7J9PHF7_METMI|nr:putative MATE family efflux protein [Methanococcus maripaludis]
MEQVRKLKSENINKLILRYVIPSIAGTVIIGIYSIIDGIFIGRTVGAEGLAGVTLAFPVLIAIGSIGIMIGAGASAIISISLGKKDYEMASRILKTAFYYIILISFIITFLGLLFIDPVISGLNLTKNLENYVLQYSKIIIIGAIAQIFAISLDPILRNDGFPKKSMIILTLMSVFNILLDYILIVVFNFGVMGAATATVFAQALGSVLYLKHFLLGKSNVKIGKNSPFSEFSIIKRIAKTGFSPFIMELAFGILMIVHNIQFIRYGSSLDVSAYGIVIYITSFLYMVYLGISEGVQPLISYNYGAKKFNRVFEILKKAVFINAILGICSFLTILNFPNLLIKIFNPHDTNLIATTTVGLEIHNFAILILGVSMVLTMYFLATEQPRIAGFLSLGRTIIFILPAIIVFPIYFGIKGIWWATVFSEYMGLIFTIYFIAKEIKKIKRRI